MQELPSCRDDPGPSSGACNSDSEESSESSECEQLSDGAADEDSGSAPGSDEVRGVQSASDEEATPSDYESAMEEGGDEDATFQTSTDEQLCSSVEDVPRSASIQPSADLRSQLAAMGLALLPARSRSVATSVFDERHTCRPCATTTDGSTTAAVLPPASSTTPSTDSYHLTSPHHPPLNVAPAGPELEAQVAELLRRDPEAAVALAIAIFKQLPTAALAAECDRVFGHAAPEQLVRMESLEIAESAQAPSSPIATAARRQPPERLGVDVTPGAITPVVRKKRCPACDTDGLVSGEGATPQCMARALLESLKDDLEARDQIVADEIATGLDPEATHRSARWFCYRTYVAAKYGYLGKGVRVRIPDCAIAEIRMRYRAPACAAGCMCDATAIVSCPHYRGHRDA